MTSPAFRPSDRESALRRWCWAAPLALGAACGASLPALAQTPPAAVAAPAAAAGPSYADLATLADSATLVVKARVRTMTRVEERRALSVRPGFARYYVEGTTSALLADRRSPTGVLGGTLAWLVDLPLDAKGRPPKLKKLDVLLFARPVAGRPGDLQLVSPGAQLAWSAPLETTVREILVELVSGKAPPRITGVREMIYVPGTLAGQGETQVFLNTADGTAASITVRHEPGQPLAWGASFSELTADLSSPPRPGTLTWFRLACGLPNTVPASANLSDDMAAKRQAMADYRTVLGELGPCARTLP